MNKKWYFAGCSLSTTGYVEKNKAYPCLIGAYFNKEIEVIAKVGNSNQMIFVSTLEALLKDDCEVVFVQITTPGREHFQTNMFYRTSTLSSNPLVPEGKWQTFKDMYRFVDQEYNQYTLINQYIPILNSIAKLVNKKLIFINGYLFFDELFFTSDEVNDFYKLKEETKNIINFDNETDENIKLQIDDIKHKLSVIDKNQWIALFKPLSSYRVDLGSDNVHPGTESNSIFANLIIDYIKSNGIQ